VSTPSGLAEHVRAAECGLPRGVVPLREVRLDRPEAEQAMKHAAASIRTEFLATWRLEVTQRIPAIW